MTSSGLSDTINTSLKIDTNTVSSADENKVDSPKTDHFSIIADEVENSAAESNGTDKEYDFGSGSSRRNSDDYSWETVSEELREEALEHQSEGACLCHTCSMKSLSISSRIKNRNLYTSMILPENVSKVISVNGAKIYIIGTAHFSKASQDDVEKAIKYLSPDVVMVQLCPSRVGVLKYDEESLMKAAQEVNLTKLRMAIKESGSVISGIMQILLLSMSAHITKQLGMAPGGEFRVAAKQAQLIPGCRLVLGDRPIQATLGRAMASLSVFQKLKLGWHLLFSKENISKEDVEKYKQKDMIAEMLAEMTGDFPELSRVFVQERDQYMAQMLVHCADIVKNNLPSYIFFEKDSENDEVDNEATKNGTAKIDDEKKVFEEIEDKEKDDVTQIKNESNDSETSETQQQIPSNQYEPIIVGVVGIGHMNGIIENIGKPYDLKELNEVPPSSYGTRAIKFFFKAAVVVVISWGVYSVVKWAK